MDTPAYVLHGAPGSGATPIHMALTLIGVPFEVIDVAPWRNDDERARLAAVNAMRQVPVLVTAAGEVMTESAAILVWLGDAHPAADLAPPIGDPRRGQYLRWMSFVSSSIYSLYWLRDVPGRLAATEDAEAVILDRSADRIAECWRVMDSQMPRTGRYLLGERLSMLDLYVTVVSRWTPRRLRFYREAPRMAEVVRRVDADPRLADAWAARFPFSTGWESQPP